MSNDLSIPRVLAVLDDMASAFNEEFLAHLSERKRLAGDKLEQPRSFKGAPTRPKRTQPITADEYSALLAPVSSASRHEREWGLLNAIDSVLGVVFAPAPRSVETEIGLFAPGLEPDPAIIDKLVQRRDARAARDFARADAIRDELAAMGYAIKDAPGGKVEVTRAR